MLRRTARLLVFIAMVIPLVLTSCFWTSSSSSGVPVINSFNATPSAVAEGSPAVLDWNVSDATALIIDQGVGTVSSSGTSVVTPAGTTTYTLTAVNAAGAVTRTVTVSVTAASSTGTSTPTVVVPVTPLPPSGPLPVATFNVSPGAITPAGTAVLNWSVANAANVWIDHGVGSVSTTGSRAVSPNVTTDYTLTASNAVGSITSVVRLVVGPVGSAPHTPSGPFPSRWVGNRFTSVYHNPGCSVITSVPSTAYRWFDTTAEALAAGYHPCTVCNPPPR